MSLKQLNLTQLAEVTGIERRAVKERLKDFKPVGSHGNSILYEASEAVRIILGYKDEDDPKKLYTQLREENLRLEKAKADKLELENAKTRGEQVQIDDVCKAVEKEYNYVRASLLAIPTKRAKAITYESDPAVVQAMLLEDINEALEHLQADKNLEDSLGSEHADNGQSDVTTSTNETPDP